MTKRKPFQKLLMIIAAISYLAGIGCALAAGFLDRESGDPVIASLMASTVFFAGVGIVLQVIGSTNLPNLKIENN
jgi:hypothetical protein